MKKTLVKKTSVPERKTLKKTNLFKSKHVSTLKKKRPYLKENTFEKTSVPKRMKKIKIK